MNGPKTGAHRTLKTAAAMGILLLVFFFQGAAVAVCQLDGAASAAVRGLMLWGLALMTAAFYRGTHKTLAPLGFRRPDARSFRQLYFFIPPVFAAAANFLRGVAAGGGIGMLVSNLFLALGIGFCEELYFRGILCSLWLKTGEGTAIWVSSALFAVCHLMNLAGGAGIAATILQICFAMVYGIVCALIFIICRSIWPCVALHALHDFCSFLSAGGSKFGAIAAGGIQFAILFGYALVITKKRRAARERDRAFHREII